MNRKTLKTFYWVIIFGIAMAFMEAAIVIYLRKLYYPEGFSFPLKMIDPDIFITEFLREFATLIMLAGIGIIAGKKNIERFAYFIFSFAVWDIFYYLFLKIMLNWPGSLMTWDILFLIPVTWVGPVIAPLINSFTMIFLAISIMCFADKKGNAILKKTDWLLLITGSLVVIFAYTQEFSYFLLKEFSLQEIFNASNKDKIIAYSCTYIPKYFNWCIFSIGEFMHLTVLTLIIIRNKKIPANNYRDL
jgi:hypothetical protein